MSWRSIQLGNQLCDQDQLILNLFKNKIVNYVGTDTEFQQQLLHDNNSKNLVLVLNKPIWISSVVAVCREHLNSNVDTFYIGINRYQVLGNDTNRDIKCTDNYSSDLIQLITNIAKEQGFEVVKSGQHNQDLGRYFNFVQPLTWIYGHKITNQSH